MRLYLNKIISINKNILMNKNIFMNNDTTIDEILFEYIYE